jgi:SNF2 family DNA or RNA helicase
VQRPSRFNSLIRRLLCVSRAKTATKEAIRRSGEKTKALNEKLRKIMIERKKEDVLKDQLPEKSELLVLCALSPLQKLVYQHILSLPDFDLVRKAQAPCDCSINTWFFRKYHKLVSVAERREYYRKHEGDIVKRKKCCYRLPLNPNRDQPGQPRIDPDAALWRMMDKHQDDEGCDYCPLCCSLPAFIKL